jgi:acetyl esterase/lipase
MFKENAPPLHPSDPVLSAARLHPSFLEDGARFGCMLVLPGGGYEHVSHQEGPPVAGWLNSIGISAAVLEYTVSAGQAIYPGPQQQALYALRWLRANADELKIDPKRIGVIGFSAGGHLAACLAHGFDRADWLLDPDGELTNVSARPDAALYSYPVISSEKIGHAGSFRNLLGRDATDSAKENLSWERQAHPKSPPTFLWHTAEDAVVPVENSYLMALALQNLGIAHELHVFPRGRHGLGLCAIDDRRHASAAQWTQLARNWLYELGF